MKSFRDPAGAVHVVGGRVLRVVQADARHDLRQFLASKTAERFASALVKTAAIQPHEAAALIGIGLPDGAEAVEHDRIIFPSYPYEWPAEMLHKAGQLTLEIAKSALDDGLGLKDATPYNVLFRGPHPVFVDVLSFERRDPLDAVWKAAAQFERTMLLPLLVNRSFQVGIDQALLTRRDGLEPEDVYPMARGLQRFAPAFLQLVSLPAWLAPRTAAVTAGSTAPVTRIPRTDDPERARFVLQSLFSRLGSLLEKVSPVANRRSTWSGYTATREAHSASYFEQKSAFVSSVLQQLNPQNVLDVGCNTGHFSVLAARQQASVVAIDADAVAVGQLWRTAHNEQLDILPLVVDLTRPTPAVGWRNSEHASFLDRARNHFDAVLMLAVIHHMLVTERIPLDEIIGLAAELTTSAAVIEYVDPRDDMFRQIARGRDALHATLTQTSFESACSRHFVIERSEVLAGGTRVIYLLRKR